MRAKTLHDLLQKSDRIAVSNITGREASKVSIISQRYAECIVGGWALGKGGHIVEYKENLSIPVYASFEELMKTLPADKRPNKIIVYSPPEAVYGEVKEIVDHSAGVIETIFIITEHVSIEVATKINIITSALSIDVIGCNTLGIINVHDHVRIGAVGGNDPEESFIPGSATIISNSGNMVNTIASYISSAGIGIAFGLSTGKDVLILSRLKDFLLLAENDPKTRIVLLYIEPGGIYEKEAIEMMLKKEYSKPIVVYVAGQISEHLDVSLGHAGAVIEGKETSATEKMNMFDNYFGIKVFDPDKKYPKDEKTIAALRKGIRIGTLHHFPRAVNLIYNKLDWPRDFKIKKRLKLNPWFINLGELEKKLPSKLVLHAGSIIEPYASQFKAGENNNLGKTATRRNMQNASYASGNDGRQAFIYGHSLNTIMHNSTFTDALILMWLGELPRYDFESKLVEMGLIAALTNGPGTISAQGAKLSASAGNNPNTAMISTLACTGTIHGGNGKKATKFLLETFTEIDLKDPYDPDHGIDIEKLALKKVEAFKKIKKTAKEAGIEYEKIPCLGHPVFNKDTINYDPRERIIYAYIKEHKLYNIFFEYYHLITTYMKKLKVTSKVLAVNVDAAIACTWLAICWDALRNKRITLKRVLDIPFIAFALGRTAGGAGEFLDHQDHGTDMDMRIGVDQCKMLIKPEQSFD